MLVVNASKNFGGDFIDLEKVVKVSGGVILSEFAIAVGTDRCKVCLVFCVLDVDAPVWRIERTVASHASWSNAVKSIAAVFGANK